MVVNVIGNELALEEDNTNSNPGGYGPNGSGPSAFTRY